MKESKKQKGKNEKATKKNAAPPKIQKDDNHVAYQNKDITSKALAEAFKGKTFRVYGLNLPEIRAVLPTNIPTVTVKELRLDNLFELADGTAAIVDYESDYKKADKIKYLNYLTGIANRYQAEKRDCPQLHMVVIYTGDITRKQVSAEYNVGAVKMTLEPAFLSELDSDRIFRQLESKVEKNELLEDEDLMKFIIMPLSYRKKEEKEEKIRETVTLATHIQDRRQQLFTLAGILAFTDKLIDEETADRIRRMIEMTKVARIFEEEKLQALAKAEEETKMALAKVEEEKEIALAKAEEKTKMALAKVEEEKEIALAKAEEEIKMALAKAEEEKETALAKVEEEKETALAKAEEENKLNLAREKKECVLKMIRKSYPSEEIASIVSGFTLDEIDAIRREISAQQV